MPDAPNEARGIPVATRRPVIPDYELLRPIGSGSYGDVWLARGITGIFRAVKVVWRERFADAEPFEREFRGLKEFAAISLKTEGQMALLHIGRNEAEGFFYYVMELADDANSGRTFDPSSYVPLTFKEWKQRRGRVPAREVIAAGQQLATALAALHARGLVHRDIKPSNGILVDGRAKLADIGLVAAIDEAKTFIGTSGYVPPEGPGAPAADVFALGRVLYELASGLRHEDFPKLPPDLEQPGPEREAYFALNEVLLRACAPLASNRYKDAGEMAADLTGLSIGRSGPRPEKPRWAVTVAAAAVLGAVGGVVWWQPWKTPVDRFDGPGRPPIHAVPSAPVSEARKLLAQANTLLEPGDDMNRENLRLVEDLLIRAHALDPADGEVLAAQALVSDTLISNGSDRTRARLETLRAQAERALKLAPTSDQAAFAYALYLWRVDFFSRQESAAGRESRQRLRALVAKSPNHGAYRRALAFVLVDDPATRGEAIAEWERAHQVAGGDAVAMAQAAVNHFFAGNMVEAERAVAASLAIRPLGRALTTDVLLKLAWRGDLDGAAAAMQRWPEWLAREDRGAYVAWTVWLWRNEPEKALAAIRAVSRDLLNDTLYRGPRAVLEAFALEAGGRREAAQEAWTEAARDVETMSGHGSVQAWMRVLVRAKLGDIAGAETALQALVQAWNDDEALLAFITSTSPFCYPEPREIITGPTVASFPTFARRVGGENYRGARTVPRAALRLNPAFAVWRADPRFAALVADAPAPEVPDQPGPGAASPPSAAGPPPDDKSVAILPFESLSAGPEDALFTDGMHAEMIATLGRVPGLRVISRTSALRFKDTKHTMAEIGRQLNVANVVTGSVRRAGSQVRINLELRRASDEALLWASPRADREFADVWALQDEMADAVARVLQVRADSGWYVGAKLMTKNERAYELFLQARDIPQRKGPTLEALSEQAALAEEALRLDPDFMYAAALATSAYAYMLQEPDPVKRKSNAARAKHWAERASALMPGGGGDGALAVYYGMVERNRAKAIKFAENEVRALPNDSNGHNRLAVNLMDFGRWTEAGAAYDRAMALDPLNVRVLHNRVAYFAAVRRLAEFEEAAARSLEQGGRNIDYGRMLVLRADLTGRVPEAIDESKGTVFPNWRVVLLLYAGRYDEVLALATAEAGKEAIRVDLRQSMHLARALALTRLGRTEECRESGRDMLRLAEATPVVEEWEQSGHELYRAWGLALTGRGAEALQVARRVVEQASDPSQTRDRWFREWTLAQLYAWDGRAPEAVAVLARLLRVPSYVTVHQLRLHPVWDAIRDDPEFQGLLMDPKNQEPLRVEGSPRVETRRAPATGRMAEVEGGPAIAGTR